MVSDSKKFQELGLKFWNFLVISHFDFFILQIITIIILFEWSGDLF